jgi:DNA-binding SARP family transcriptional activator/tetratricopeptide (TPR) repeat protein
MMLQPLPDTPEKVDALNREAMAIITDNPQAALELIQQAQALAQNLSYTAGSAASLCNLGHVYYRLSNYQIALDFCNKAEALYTELEDSRGLAKTYHNMASVYHVLGDPAKALALERKNLKIVINLNDIKAEADGLHVVALVYSSISDFANSLKYNFESMDIRQRIGDKLGEALSLNNIGKNYFQLNDYSASLAYFHKSLAISEVIQNKYVMSRTLTSMGAIFYRMADYTNALEYFLRSLTITSHINDKLNESQNLSNIGQVYRDLGDAANALKYFYKSLSVSQEIGYKFIAGNTLQEIGKTYLQLQDFANVKKYYGKSLYVRKEISDKEGQAETSLEFGTFLLQHNDMRNASKHLHDALAIATEIKAAEFGYRTHEALARLYKQKGMIAKSREHMREYKRGKEQVYGEEQLKKAKSLIMAFETSRIREEALRAGLSMAEVDEVSHAIQKATLDKATAKPSPAQNESADDPSPLVEIFIRTFGKFSVTINGNPLQTSDWPRKKARDVFKILLLNYGKSVTTDELIDLLLPNSVSSSPKHIIQNAITYIRQAVAAKGLKSNFIEQEGNAYRLDFGEGATIDFLEFKRLIAIAQGKEGKATKDKQLRFYEQAINLYAGDFLKEDHFEEWSSYERETLKEAYLDALVYLSTQQLSAGQYATVAKTCRKILDVDRIYEKGYDLMFTALQKQSKTNEIKKLYKECSDAFEKESGIAPPERFRKYL